MKKLLLGTLLALLILSFGCINMAYDQAISPDGSSVLNATLDMSALTTYMENLTSSLSALTTVPKPDLTYNAGDYAALPSFESKNLTIDIKKSLYGDDPLLNLSPGKYVSLSFEIKNNGEEVQDMSVSLESGALVSKSSYYGSEDYVGTLAKRDFASAGFYPTVANVTPGTYQMTVIAQYDTVAKKNITVAKTFSFTVKPAEPVEMPDYDKIYASSCENMTQKNPKVNCTYGGGKLTISGALSPDGDIYSFNKEDGLFETVYNVNLTALPNMDMPDLSETGSGGLTGSALGSETTPTKFEDGLDTGISSISTMKTMMKLTYTVHMPAKIENASSPGKISADGMSVTYDVLDLYDEQKSIEITSREEHTTVKWLVIGGVALVALVILAMAVWLLFLRPKPKP